MSSNVSLVTILATLNDAMEVVEAVAAGEVDKDLTARAGLIVGQFKKDFCEEQEGSSSSI